MNELCLQMKGVTLWHRGGRLTADRVSLQIKEGEWVLITGDEPEDLRSLCKTAAGIERPQDGNVLLLEKYAYLPEIFPYMERMKVVDYLLLPQLIQGISRRIAWENIRMFVKESDLWIKRTERIEFLTAYEKCMLLLITAFMVRPKLVLAGDCMWELMTMERERTGKVLECWAAESQTAILAFGNTWKERLPFHKKFFLREGKLETI